MWPQNNINHVIQIGDTLYQLSIYYQTTVSDILALNPGIDPNNLMVGSSVVISPGSANLPGKPNQSQQIILQNDMREAWIQHVYWTRMLLISIAERLKDQQAVAARLLQNPADIANIFGRYYTPEAASMIRQLLTEHLQIGAALITALRDGNHASADVLTRQWYANADRMATAFSSINPYFNREQVLMMLYRHLALTTSEVTKRLAGNYAADILAFNEVEKEALMMADYFSRGIMNQFPQSFMGM